jgi:hypothetical protein
LEERIGWDDLPATLKDAISARTGPVVSGRAATDGQNSPLAKGLSPELLWQFDEDGWNVNGFEHIDGRKANYQPGSPDLGPVTELMTALSRIRANRRMWDEIEAGRPAPWTQTMAAVARA